MSLNIVEKSLDKVKPEHHGLYVKKSDGKYHLDLKDLNSHVETQLKPLKAELNITRASERKLLLNHEFGSALRNAGIRSNYEELIIANFGDRVTFDIVDNQRVIRIKDADGGMLYGTGPGGTATFDDLAKEATKNFPSVFPAAEKSGAHDATSPSPVKRAAKTLLKSEFEALDARQRAAKMHEGYTLVDDEPASKPNRTLANNELTRAAFDALDGKERAAKMKEGFKLVE